MKDYGHDWTEKQRERWIRLTPWQRMHISGLFLIHHIKIGGSLDPEPDPQSPFYFEEDDPDEPLIVKASKADKP